MYKKYFFIFFIVFSTSFAELEKATFAGGCFWCMEPPFEKENGVIEVVSGYMGGHKNNPSYKEVSSGSTGHREVVQIIYDSQKISYNKLLNIFWQQIDPTDKEGQFVDRGFQYTTAVFYHNDSQKKTAEKSKQNLENQKLFSKKIITPVIPAKIFYRAEEYHQNYYKKNSLKYKYYRFLSGRDQFLKKIWKENKMEKNNRFSNYIKPKKNQLKKQLTKLQYKVTQEKGTERAFTGKLLENKREGIYVDILSGEPLFSSTNKFKSGTGWPSFTKPIDENFIVEKKDKSLFITRIEIKSKYADSHLGHVFPDGPEPTGLRYCVNSAALKFIPKEKMIEEGYEEYLYLFE